MRPLKDRLGRDPEEHYQLFEHERKKWTHLLSANERWLTPNDYVQYGDSYMGHSPDWWPFSRECLDAPIKLDYFCYTPKGSVNRERT